MEKAFAILLGISFAGIALFGFSVASAMVDGAHVGCVADMFQELQGSACPVSETPFSLLASHLNSLQDFVGSTGAGVLTLLTLAAFALFSSFSDGAFAFAPVLARARIVETPRAVFKYVRWTALHETSPTRFV